MEKAVNVKLEKWTKKDFFRGIFVYFLNFLIIAGIFLGSNYLYGEHVGVPYSFTEENIMSIARFSLITLLILIAMGLYFFFEERNFARKASNIEMLFLILEVSLIICFVIDIYANVYLRPLALVALMTMYLWNKKNATMLEVVFCSILAIFDSVTGLGFNDKSYVTPLLSIIIGTVALVSLSNVYSRLKMLLRGLIISLPIAIVSALTIIDVGFSGAIIDVVYALLSGLLTVAVFIILLPVFERIFKKVTSFTLNELTDHNARLIKKMIREAPGTFNHSIVVSNIAEACATSIGEDALLARACAYYHDAGKLRRPEFFSENQIDMENMHDDLTPELSVNIIKAHATDGYDLLKKNKIPEIIASVCKEHHGTLPILYFYEKAKKFTDGEVDIEKYSYYGPKPRTKIAAIIMIADGCEAATRTLKNRSAENVKATVRKIVNDRMKLGQFDECDITIYELNIIISTVVNSLTGVYHGRVKYPKVSLDGIAEEINKEENEKEENEKDKE